MLTYRPTHFCLCQAYGVRVYNKIMYYHVTTNLRCNNNLRNTIITSSYINIVKYMSLNYSIEPNGYT